MRILLCYASSGNADKLCRYFMSRLWLRQEFPTSNFLPNNGRDVEWQYRGHADYGFRDCRREKVSCRLLSSKPKLILRIRYQSRAFLLFPMCFNIGVIIGPILGGLLADPAASYPKLFGNIEWLKRFPYATPNIVSAFFLFCAGLGVFFGLAEVHSLVSCTNIITDPSLDTRISSP